MSATSRGPLLPEQQQVLAQIAELGEPDLTETTPQQARALRDSRPMTRSIAMYAVEDLPAGALGPVAVRVFRAGPGVGPVVVWLHGGGWVMGSWVTHDSLLRSLVARTGAHVVAPDYRLAPEHPFPAAIEDCAGTVAAIVDHGDDLGLLGSACVLGGDSAGGNLAAVVALEAAPGALRGLVLAYPVTDCRMGTASYLEAQDGSYLHPEWMRWFRGHYLPAPELADDWRASPVLAPDALLRRLPKAYVVVASHDPLRDEGLAWAARVRDAGGSVVTRTATGLTHGFLGWEAAIPQAAAWFADLAGFVRVAVGTAAAGQRSRR